MIGVAYPPTFFALQGAWLWLGSHLFHYNLTVNYNLYGRNVKPQIPKTK